MTLEILCVDVLLESLLELREHLGEIRLLVTGRSLLLHHHTCRTLRLVRTQKIAEVDEFCQSIGRSVGACLLLRNLCRLGPRGRGPMAASGRVELGNAGPDRC